MKSISIGLALLLLTVPVFAQTKQSDPFTVGLIGRVCIKETCQTYNQRESIHVSEFDFNGTHQVNLYIKTSETGVIQDLGSAEVMVRKMSELNSIAQYSVPIQENDLRIEPVVLVGPTMAAVKLRALDSIK